MSPGALGAWLACAFAAWVVAHGALVVGLARRGRWWRAVFAAIIPPLAPAWGWSMRGRAYAWTLALAAYALGVLVAR